MLNKIDHVGIAVKSLDQIKELYKAIFNLDPVFEEEVAEQKVNVAGFKVGESQLEFLEPTADDSPIAKYLDKKGEGLHHIAVNVDNINDILQRMEEEGIPLIDQTPRIGAEGKKIAFVHPKGLNGILLELSQD